jgi:hypothetical protein
LYYGFLGFFLRCFKGNILLFIREKILMTSMGAAAGKLLSILPNLFSEDIIKTIVLAAIGATVSFLVSLLLKWIMKFLKKVILKQVQYKFVWLGNLLRIIKRKP